MAQPKNLYEYYTQQGQTLPSIQERGILFEQAGLGKAKDYGGTAQQNISLQASLTATPGDMTATDLTTGGQTIQIPSGKEEPSSTGPADAAVAGYEADMKAEYDRKKAALERSGQAIEDEPIVSKEELRAQGLEEIGYKEFVAEQKTIIAEAKTYRDTMANMEGQKQQEIIAMREQGGISMVTRNAREGYIEMKWNSRIAEQAVLLNSSMATLDALNNNMTRAQAFMDKAVDAVLYDQTQNLERLKTIRDINRDMFDIVGTEYTRAYNLRVKEEDRKLREDREDRTNVGNLMISNPRAGITLDMTLEKALELYQLDEIRKAQETPDIPTFEFVSKDVSKLMAVGLSAKNIQDIQRDIRTYGVELVATGLNKEQARMLSLIMTGEEPEEEFLSREYFEGLYSKKQLRESMKELYNEEELQAKAKEAGFGRTWKGAKGEIKLYLEEKGVEDYLNRLTSMVEQYRGSGLSDKKILEMLTE